MRGRHPLSLKSLGKEQTPTLVRRTEPVERDNRTRDATDHARQAPAIPTRKKTEVGCPLRTSLCGHRMARPSPTPCPVCSTVAARQLGAKVGWHVSAGDHPSRSGSLSRPAPGRIVARAGDQDRHNSRVAHGAQCPSLWMATSGRRPRCRRSCWRTRSPTTSVRLPSSSPRCSCRW